MRCALVSLVVLALSTAVVGPAQAAPPDFTDANLAYILGVLRTEAARHGMQVPDLHDEVAEGARFDGATGQIIPIRIRGDAALRQLASVFSSVDLATLSGGSDVAGVPTVGVGDNIHGYAGLRLFDCAPHADYAVAASTPVGAPGTIVPNPAGTPVAAAIVWGGPGFRATGGGWLLGAHIFAGAPLDVNVHTDGSGVSPALAAGLDSTIDTLAVGQLAWTSIAVKFLGICLFSIDAGYILENGALSVDGDLLPV
jgi:hypothetical protein